MNGHLIIQEIVHSSVLYTNTSFADMVEEGVLDPSLCVQY